MKIIKRDRLKICISRALSKVQARLHTTPNAIVLLDYKLTDANGVDVLQVKGKSNSFVRNYHNVAALQTLARGLGTSSSFGAGYLSIKDTAGVATYGNYTLMGAPNAGTSDVIGLVVGTGTSAENFENHALETRIASGAGAGQLTYSNQSNDYSLVGTAVTASMSRSFTNNSGSPINIHEVGVYQNVYINGSTAKLCMLIRDKLGSPITVANGETVTITYTFSYTMPE